ncbi:MAG: hypothetical protein ACHREM_25290, partial [Polyangiales bacterium]
PMRPGVLVANDDPRVASLMIDLDFNFYADRADLCRRLLLVDPRRAHRGPFARSVCESDPTAKPAAVDRSTPALFVDSLVALDRTPARPPPSTVLPELRSLVERVPIGEERALVRGMLGRTMHHAGDEAGGCTMMRAAAAEAPALDALWLALAELCPATPALEFATTAWVPNALEAFDGYQLLAPERELRMLRRRDALAPLDPKHAIELVLFLVRAGRSAETDPILAALDRNPKASRMDRLVGRAAMDVARGHVAAARTSLLTETLSKSTIEGVSDQYATGFLVACAYVLGSASETTDALLRHFDTPTAIASDTTRAQLPLLAQFASPSVATKLLADLAPRLVGDDVFEQRDARLASARAAHDRVTLTRELHEMVRDESIGWTIPLLIEDIGDDELTLRTGEQVRRRGPGMVAGASIAVPVMARAAMRLGRVELAKKLAQDIVEAWSALDERSPLVDEMRAIVAGTWRSTTPR